MDPKIKIVPVTDRATRRLFVQAAVETQHGDSQWVRPLDSLVSGHLDAGRNPFYKSGSGRAFLAVQDRRPVGRVLAHACQRSQRLFGRRLGYFGLFESVEDQGVTDQLLDAARAYLCDQSCLEMFGPIDITPAQEMGTVVNGFDRRPSIDMEYNPPWHDGLFQNAGLRPCLAMTTWRSGVIADIDPDVVCNKDKRARLTRQGIETRPLLHRHTRRDLELSRDIVNDAFLGNWGFVPITPEEWDFQIGPLAAILDPALILFAERDGVPVGVTMAVPNFNLVLRKTNGRLFHPATLRLLSRRPLDEATVILFAVRKAFQGRGVSRLLNAELAAALQRRGYRRLSITWIAEQNASSQAQARALGMEPLHRLRAYHQALA